MRVLFTGGATGGHIYPALALGRYIRKEDPTAELQFVGAKGGLEEKIIPQAGFILETLEVKGFPRRFTPAFFKSCFLLGRAVLNASRILRTFKPDVIIGTGGFAAAPVVMAGLVHRKRVILHEQNVLPGLANRVFAPWVYGVCLSYEASKDYFRRSSNLYLTGNPRASEMEEVEKDSARNLLGLDPELPLVLAVGGSGGAEKLNQCMLDFLFLSAGNKNLQVLYVTGEKYYEQVISRLAKGKIIENYGGRLQVRAYQQEIPLAISAADLMITRAGATTLAELTALGRAAIVVPSPNVVHNHQLLNAQELFNHGAVSLIEERGLSGQVLQDEVYRILYNSSLLEQMSQISKSLGCTDAASNIYKLFLS